MAFLLESQTDFIYFFSCLAHIILAAVCFTLGKAGNHRLPWVWLVLFGVARSIGEWLDLMTYSLGDNQVFGAARICIMAVSFLFLAEFGRSGMNRILGRGPGRWVLLPLLAVAVAGGLAGLSGLTAVTMCVMGLAGGAWAACALFMLSRRVGHSTRPWMLAGGTATGLYAIITGLVVPGIPIMPTLFKNDRFFLWLGFPVQITEGLLALGIAAALWVLLRDDAGLYKGHTSSRYALRMVVIMASTLCFGWAVTQFWGDRALNILRQDSRTHISALSNLIGGELTKTDFSAASMARSPWIAPALVSGDSLDIQRANSVLDRYRETHETSVCYLLDITGTTVASSNRDSPDSFVGKFYGFRPYFRQAVKGLPGRYFALGVTSRERGYYASFPVRDGQGKIVGAAVVKSNIDMLENDVRRHDYCFFVDPQGIIFLSSRPEMLFKGLWPIKKEVQNLLSASQQFGPGPFEPVLPAEYADGSYFDFGGQLFLMNRQFIGEDGWSIALMNSTFQIRWYRLFCITLTLILFLLAIVFSVALYLTRDYAGRIAASERRYYSLVQGSPNCIMLFDREGRFITINRSGLYDMGFGEDDATGRRFAEIWPEEVRPGVDRAINQVLQGFQMSFEAGYVRPDGLHITWNVVLNPIYDEDGHIRHFVAISTNITERKQAEEAIRENEVKFRTLFDSANDAILIMDGMTFVDCNPKTLEMFGCSREQIIGRSPGDFSPDFQPGGRSSGEMVSEYIKAVLEGEAKYFQWQHRTLDGTLFEVEISLNRIRLKDRYYVQAMLRDITHRKQQEEQLRLQAAALGSAANAIVITGLDGRITWINPAFTALTGYDPGEVMGQKMVFLNSGRQDRAFYQELWETVFSGQVWHGEMVNRRKDGTHYFEEQTITPVRDTRGEITHFIAIKQDISHRKQQEQQLSYLATHDSLTGLPNRRLLEEALKRAVARARRGTASTLLFMDLDNFKVVNDTLGHAAGDQVLFTLTKLVRGVLRTEDLLVRFGGDELAVLLEGSGIEEGCAVAERMRREVEEYRFTLDDHSFHLTLSIGLVAIDGQEDPGTVLSQADTAMYMSKDQGRNRAVLYRPEDGVLDRLSEANQWVVRIKSALKENRFVLYYQPLVRMADDQVDHCEVLIRMRAEDGEIISPGSFIPAAERFGLMPQLDRWVFNNVIVKLHDHPGARLFMNLSGHSLADEALLDYIEYSIQRSGVDPRRLGFEITETAAIQDLVVAERWVRRLKTLGCRFALDDFGSGFNSFIYLRKLPVDRVKIDGYYIRALENDPTRRALVQAMHALACTLGMETVAEFVENENILQIVREIGITYGQGYFLYSPEPDLPRDA